MISLVMVDGVELWVSTKFLRESTVYPKRLWGNPEFIEGDPHTYCLHSGEDSWVGKTIYQAAATAAEGVLPKPRDFLPSTSGLGVCWLTGQ